MALLMESICLKGHRGMPSLRQSLLIICGYVIRGSKMFMLVFNI